VIWLGGGEVGRVKRECVEKERVSEKRRREEEWERRLSGRIGEVRNVLKIIMM
jgi:hypothetical protein